jgi:hypothetical protein
MSTATMRMRTGYIGYYNDPYDYLVGYGIFTTYRQYLYARQHRRRTKSK